MGNITSKQKSFAQKGLSRFLNSIKYEYIPAIKDDLIFNHVLSTLQETLLDMSATQEENLDESLKEINNQINAFVANLGTEFETACGIKTRISLPSSLVHLYRALFVHTGYGDKNEHNILLNQRGDGIRVRFLPSILNYVSQMSKRRFIWGFEEPENSLEYALANKMAIDFKEKYAGDAQIFLTSHSPAFFSLKGEQVNVFRIYNKEFKTNCMSLSAAKDYPELNEELGISKFQQELHEKYVQKIKELQLINHEVTKLKCKIEETQKPVVLTEGKTDVLILEDAWEKLFGKIEKPFNIQSCDVYPENDPSGGGAGCTVLLEA